MSRWWFVGMGMWNLYGAILAFKYGIYDWMLLNILCCVAMGVIFVRESQKGELHGKSKKEEAER